MFVVCDEKCKKNFINAKGVDDYLRDRINATRKAHRMAAIKKM